MSDLNNDEQYRDKLTPLQFEVTRNKATEHAFTGEYWNTSDEGIYHCICCGAELFTSESKFDSMCGWPSFDKPLNDDQIVEELDTSLGMERTEVMCDSCGAHLRHVFPDGPPETTGLRYCINSASIDLKKTKDN